VFADIEAGRPALFEAVRWQARLGALTPAGRTYALSPEGDRARLWMLTPSPRPLWAAIEAAIAAGDRTLARQLARRGVDAIDQLRGSPAVDDLDHLTADDPPRLLATPWTPRRGHLPAQLQRLYALAVL
jgi:hypothetical protein